MVAGQPLSFLVLLFSTLVLLATPLRVFGSPIRIRANGFSSPLICDTPVKSTTYRSTCLKGGLAGGPVGGLAWTSNSLTFLDSTEMAKVVSSSVHCDHVLEVQYIKFIVEHLLENPESFFCDEIKLKPKLMDDLRSAINGVDNLLLLDGRINILKGAYFRRIIVSSNNRREIVLPVMKTEELEEGMIEYFQKMAGVQQKAIQNLYVVLQGALPEKFPSRSRFNTEVTTSSKQLLEFFQRWRSHRRAGWKLPQYAPLLQTEPITQQAALEFDQKYQADKKAGKYQKIESDLAQMQAEDFDGDDLEEEQSVSLISSEEPTVLSNPGADQDLQGGRIPFSNGRSDPRLRPLKGCKRQASGSGSGVGDFCEYNPPTSSGSGSKDRSATFSNSDQVVEDASPSSPSDPETSVAATTAFQDQPSPGRLPSSTATHSPERLPLESTPTRNPSTLRETFHPRPLRQTSDTLVSNSHFSDLPHPSGFKSILPQFGSSTLAKGSLGPTRISNRLGPSPTFKTKPLYDPKPTASLKRPTPTAKTNARLLARRYTKH